jgi:hypothetical protein
MCFLEQNIHFPTHINSRVKRRRNIEHTYIGHSPNIKRIGEHTCIRRQTGISGVYIQTFSQLMHVLNSYVRIFGVVFRDWCSLSMDPKESEPQILRKFQKTYGREADND